jgi:hypothetical protein
MADTDTVQRALDYYRALATADDATLVAEEIERIRAEGIIAGLEIAMQILDDGGRIR